MRLIFASNAATFILAILAHCGAANADATQVPRIHPKVFQMVRCWLSDTEEPLVTEMNLDAVARDRNQFDFEKVKQEGEWTSCPGDDNRGFIRYRTVKSASSHFTVEFQDNGGGSLTTSATIDFSIETREMKRDGKPFTAHVLRVEGIVGK